MEIFANCSRAEKPAPTETYLGHSSKAPTCIAAVALAAKGPLTSAVLASPSGSLPLISVPATRQVALRFQEIKGIPAHPIADPARKLPSPFAMRPSRF